MGLYGEVAREGLAEMANRAGAPPVSMKFSYHGRIVTVNADSITFHFEERRTGARWTIAAFDQDLGLMRDFAARDVSFI